MSFASITAIAPKRFTALDSKIYERRIDAAFKEGADKVQEDFGKTVETWRTNVVFQKSRPDNDTALVEIARGHPAKIYSYVDQGTKPHIIRARRFPALRFSTFFVPKTVPNRVSSSSGRTSPVKAFAKEVRHPGSKPRNFTKTIAKKWRKSWPKLFRKKLSGK